METIYEPYAVYQNVDEWATRRKLEVVNWNLEILSSDKSAKSAKSLNAGEFKKNMGIKRYIAIKLKDVEDRKRKISQKVMTILIIFEVGDFDKTDAFRKLINKIKTKEGVLVDVYIFSKEDISNNIKNVITALSRRDLRITPSNYTKMLIVVPRHVNSPAIRPLSAEEESVFLRDANTSKRNLQTTFINDPGIFWTYAEVGDIVEEIHVSETVGYEVIYKLVSA